MKINIHTFGKLQQNVQQVLTDLFYKDNCEIIIWTCRENEHKEAAKQFLIENNIPFTCINDNSPSILPKWNNCNSRKIFADFYIDDKSLYSPARFNWNEIYQDILWFKFQHINKFI